MSTSTSLLALGFGGQWPSAWTGPIGSNTGQNGGLEQKPTGWSILHLIGQEQPLGHWPPNSNAYILVLVLTAHLSVGPSGSLHGSELDCGLVLTRKMWGPSPVFPHLVTNRLPCLDCFHIRYNSFYYYTRHTLRFWWVLAHVYQRYSFPPPRGCP